MSEPVHQPATSELLSGRFRLCERLGEGGMGEVWRAEHLASGDEVAVKLLREDLAFDRGAATRFEIEARTLSRIRHPNVVRVIDFGRDPIRGSFLAVELVRGETLGSVLERRGKLPASRVVELGVQILSGLAAVHDAGVVHRDLKPENVMLEDEGAMVRLLDFGIAKLVDPAHRVDLTIAGQVFGTPAYLAPEQALGRAVDARADLYACGVILHRALLGRLPFEAETPTSMALRHAVEPLPPLPDEIPRPLAAVIERALEKEPEARFVDASEMRAALLDAGAALPSEAEPEAIAPQPIPLALTRAVGTGAVPRSANSASRTVLAVRVTRLATDPATRPSRLTPPLVARDVIDAFDGRLAWISTEGVVADFASPTDTLQCAAALHDRIAQLAPEHHFAVEVRAAIAAGEVLRNGRSLHGEPVVQAELLADAAAPGEVLFTHGVYLAMTRSEVPWEPYPGRDPGTGQKLYRLRRPDAVVEEELPFGGNTLERALAITPRRLARGAGRIADSAVHETARLAIRAGRALPPVVQRAARPGILATQATARGVGTFVRRAPALVLASLALVAGGGASFVLLPGGAVSSVEQAIAEGRAEEAVLLTAEEVRKNPKDPRLLAVHGRALVEAGQLDEARESLKAALDLAPQLASDEAVARAVVRAMDRGGADRSLATNFRTAAMERALLDATRSIRYWERWNSVRTLEKLGLEGRIDWVDVYLLDLQNAGSCGTRLKAARKLGELGDARALPSLADAADTGFNGAACNLRSAAAEAIQRIGARTPPPAIKR